jgi:predicted NUDIX family phosphoesterase
MQKKHPQFILAMAAGSLNTLPEGLSQVSMASFVQNANSDLIIRERAQLEQDEAYRQIIPYVCLAVADEEKTVFIPYRRNQGVGESRLAGKVSVGFGGHIDLADIVHQDSVVDLFQTIGNAATRELGEELIFEGASSEEISMFDNGLLIDNSNEVGRVHVGVILTALLPKGMTVKANEEELEVLAPMTATELLESGLELEPWTKIVLEAVVENTKLVEEVSA